MLKHLPNTNLKTKWLFGLKGWVREVVKDFISLEFFYLSKGHQQWTTIPHPKLQQWTVISLSLPYTDFKTSD